MGPIQISKPPTHRTLTDIEAHASVKSVQWYRAFDLRPGLMMPGETEFEAAPAAGALGIPTDLRGLRARDIGAWDGPLTFELERRGATAFALDIQDPTRVC